jgi:hypothetical protein
MRTFSPLGILRITVLAVVVVAASGSANVAADSDTRKPQLWCRWDGTAPFCDGECKSTELFRGAYATKDAAREDQPVALGVPENDSWQSFGKDCATGKKARCCLEFCPHGYTMVKGECRNVSTKTRDLELPVPEGPAVEYKKAPVTKQLPYETELKTEGTTATPPGPAEEFKKGPVAAPQEAPYATKRSPDLMTKD